MNLQLKTKCPNIVPVPILEYPVIVRDLTNRIVRGLGISSYEVRLVEVIPGAVQIDTVHFFVNGANFLSKSNWRSALMSVLGSKGFEYDTNTRTLTFEYLNHEIVLSVSETPSFLENECLYHAYGGIGRIYSLFAKRMGFVFDYKGLRIPISYNGQSISEVDYQVYFYDCLNVIGLMPSRYDRRYSSETELVNSIVGSRYFSKEIFEGELDPELVSSPIYALLAPKLADPTVVNNHSYASGKTPWLASIKKSNPQILNSIKAILRIHERKFQVDSKLSNEFITNVTGPITEVDLAKFKERFKASFKPEEDFDHYVLSSSIENLQERIRKIFTQSPENDKVGEGFMPAQIPWDLNIGDTFTSGKFEMVLMTKRKGDIVGNIQVVKAPAYCQELVGSTRSIQFDPATLPKEPVPKDPMPRYNPY